MAAFRVSEPEFKLLYGLPWEAQVLYYALRARMDFKTGLVGAVHIITWLTLRDSLYVEPHSGVRFQSLHRESVRLIAAFLERRGLIRSQANAASARLIFLLPQAPLSPFTKKKAGPRQTVRAEKQAEMNKSKAGKSS